MWQRIVHAVTVGRKGRRFYRKSFTWFLFTTCLTGLIIGGCTYWFTVRTMEKDIGSLHQNQIAERAQNIDDQFSSLEQDLSHWAFNPRFGYSLLDIDFIYYFKETRDITKTLLMLQGSHPLIQQVQLYIQGEDKMLFNPEFYIIENESLIAGFERMIQEGRTIYWTDWLPSSDGETTSADPFAKPVVLVHKIPGVGSTPFGVLVVQLKRDKVINLIRTLTPYNQGLTLLLDQDGSLILFDKKEEQDLANLLREEILRRNEPKGTFMLEKDGITYSVSYGTMNRISSEWTYVSAAPITAITSPIIAVSNTIIMVSATGLLLAMLLSWVASRRVYSPIERLINLLSGTKPIHLGFQGLDEFQYLETQWNHLTKESLKLKQRLEEQKTNLRAGFMLQLMQGHLNAYSEEDLRRMVQLYGWNIERHRLRILYVQLTGFYILQERFSPGKEDLVTFMAANIIEELAGQYFEQYSVLNFHDLAVGLLVMSPSGHSDSEALQSLGEEITKAINRIIKMQVTITVSVPIDSIKKIPDMFMEVERTAGYRNVVNKNQLIFMENLPQLADNDEVRYPFTLERDLIHAMRSGDQELADRLAAEFMQTVLDNHGTEFHVQQCMLQLFGSIQHAILQSGISTHTLFKGKNMFVLLSQIRDPDKMLHWMINKVIHPYMEERKNRENLELRRIVEKTIEYIHANYTKEISLDSCAELTGINPYTLSKLFRQVTGVNYIDYVTNLRIEKAKQLLLETDMKINNIAVQVGYQPRYFNRIFKKQLGITPGQFREQQTASVLTQ